MHNTHKRKGIEQIRRAPSALGTSLLPRSTESTLYLLQRKLERYQRELIQVQRRYEQVHDQIQAIESEMSRIRQAQSPVQGVSPNREDTRHALSKWKTRVLKY